jgi:hypothetical protein
MTDLQYPPIDPAKAKAARNLHLTASLIRLLGVGLVGLGIAIVNDQFPGMPHLVGYLMMVLGLFQTLVLPLIMIRNFVKNQMRDVNDGAPPAD